MTDNSGAKIAMCIGFIGRGGQGPAQVGNVITVSVKETHPNASISRGDIYRALIVRQKYNLQRPDGRVVSFDDNACVLLEPDLKPTASRVYGPVAQELRVGKWGRILSMAKKIV